MLAAVFQALAQMFTPPLRAVLAKSIGLAFLLLILLQLGLPYLFLWLAIHLSGYLGEDATPGAALVFVLVFAADFIGSRFLSSILIMPVVAALVAGILSDEIAAEVERVHYPADPPGVPVSPMRVTLLAAKTTMLAVLVYPFAVIFLLLFYLGFLISFAASAWLLGHQYFLLAAMRFHSLEEAKRLRMAHRGTVMLAGTFIAAFVSIPILNLTTPLFGTAFMVHMNKRLAGPRRELI